MSIEGGSQGFLLGDWRVEPSLGRISRDDRRKSPWDADCVRIDPRNMKVLQLLASRPGELVTQTEIETTVWSGLVVTPNSVYQSVAQLRRALGDDRAHPRYIETISRKGYRLIAPVTWPTAPDVAEESPAKPPVPEVSEPELSRVSPPRSPWPLRVAASVATVAALTAAYVIYDSPSSAVVAAAEEDGLAGPSRPLGAAPLTDSAVRAEVHFKLASHAWRRGDYEIARRHLEQASVAQRTVSGYRHPNMGVILALLSDVRRWGGDYAAAELLAREAQKIFASTTPEPTADTVRATMALADALIDGGKHDEAASQVERALNESRMLFRDRHELSIDVQHSLAMLRLAQGRLDEAEQIARSARDGYLKLQTNEVTTKYPFALALILLEQERYAEAAAEARREIDQLSAMTTRHTAHMAVAQHVLGRSLNKLGRCEEAEQLFRDELRGWNEIHAPRWRIARASSGLGEALLGQGRLAEAEQQLRFAATELAAARGWLPRQAMQATQERLEQLREAQKMQQIRHAQAREAERGS